MKLTLTFQIVLLSILDISAGFCQTTYDYLTVDFIKPDQLEVIAKDSIAVSGTQTVDLDSLYKVEGNHPHQHFWSAQDNDGSLKEVDHIVSIDQDSTFVLTILDTNNCTYSQIFKFYAIEDKVTNIDDEVYKASVHVYPNPNKGVFTIRFNKCQSCKYEISVLNAVGNRVFHKVLNIEDDNLRQEISLSAPSGMYILQISNRLEINFERISIVN